MQKAKRSIEYNTNVIAMKLQNQTKQNKMRNKAVQKTIYETDSIQKSAGRQNSKTKLISVVDHFQEVCESKQKLGYILS